MKRLHRTGNVDELREVLERFESQGDAPRLSYAEARQALVDWGDQLDQPALRDITGLTFLRLWLRASSLDSLVRRELGEKGAELLYGQLSEDRTWLEPVGTLLHWTAGNVSVQPFLSLTGPLLAGNRNIVRVSTGLIEIAERLLAALDDTPLADAFFRQNLFVHFPYDDQPQRELLARRCDGALAWGGEDTMLTVRAFPFPHWARIELFGPRVSLALMDRATWSGPEAKKWCRRLARDVWQFEQQACSSPLCLYLEEGPEAEVEDFLRLLADSFAAENRAHPRESIAPHLSAKILRARADWLLQDPSRGALFPPTPDWTLLWQRGKGLQEPVQGKTLHVQILPRLEEALDDLDGNVQTIGLGFQDAELEVRLARRAAVCGIDRLVRIGQMHTFQSPWDGKELLRPFCRFVVFSPSAPVLRFP